VDLFQLTDKGDAPFSLAQMGQKKEGGDLRSPSDGSARARFDEPFTGGLDSSAILALRRVLKHLAARGEATIVWHRRFQR